MSRVRNERGRRQMLPDMEQPWSPEMASVVALCAEPDKQTYDTRQEAAAAATTVRRHGGRKLEPYQCTCGQFHLTKHRRV